MSLYTVKVLDDLTIFTTERRKPSPFTAKWGATKEQLGRELRKLSAHDVVLELAVTPRDIRKDGQLAENARRPSHPGVRLSFIAGDLGEMSFTCDTYTAWEANVRAVVLTLESLRAVDRYGATKGEQYAGFAALPAGKGAVAMGGMTRDQAAGVLSRWSGVHIDADESDQSARARWREARAAAHPDRHGGFRSGWDEVEQAARVLGLTS